MAKFALKPESAMETLKEVKKEKKKLKKKENRLVREAINVIRTTQRNNVELTHLADNKANVLLSLNALMLTFLIPGVLSNTEYIIERFLYIPLFILALTCFATIYISTLVLKPSNFEKFHDEDGEYRNYSPFFFGNFYRMAPEEFFTHLDESLSNRDVIRKNLAQDMYYVGRRLGFKMTWIRRAFSMFLWGIFLSIVSTFVVLAI